VTAAPHVTALLTCHNRAQRTLGCLTSLYEQTALMAVALEVVLVDAGSSDGTAEGVAERFPDVRILPRGPELFWNGGMRVAFADAYQRDPDHYLWLNDDVELDEDALAVLLHTHRELSERRGVPCIVVGSTRDPVTSAPTYGGVVRRDRWRPLHYDRIAPGELPQPADAMNGNCVLVPREAAALVGNLAGAYTHGMGDFDYGHRLVRAGGEVWVAPGTLGTCARNPIPKRVETFEEYRQLAGSTTQGLPPTEWFTFARRWAGPLWPVYGASPYIRRFARWASGRSP
jgi:GT2 family glycosyltransferase